MASTLVCSAALTGHPTAKNDHLLSCYSTNITCLRTDGLLVITSCLKYLYRLHLSTDGILMFTSCLIINITYICWPMDYLCLPVVLSTNITCTPMESSFLPLVLSTSKVHLPTLRQSSSEIRRSALMPAAQIWITAWTLHSFQNLKKRKKEVS